MKIQKISDIKIKLQSQDLTEHAFENIELKRDWNKSYGEKLSMLCNGYPENDCFLIVGVEDNGAVAGHNEAWLSTTLGIISQHCNQYLDPSISLLDITTEDVNGSKIVICHVRSPGVVVKWNRTAFRGKGTTKIKMSQEDIMELNLSLPGFTDASKKQIDFVAQENLVVDFCTMADVNYDHRVLSRYSLENTRAGKLLFGNSKFRVVKYDNHSEVLINETRYGLLNLLTMNTFDEIRRYYADSGTEANRITDGILREALGNCVGHAAYIENDGELIIEMYPNRIVFSNLAYTEYSSLANKWFSSAHKSPNGFLMEALRLGRRVDELGRGKKKLLSECLINGFIPPVVTVSEAGRFKRWSLQINIQDNGERYTMIRESLLNYYGSDKEKALIAYALVLWSNKAFSEIKNYFDMHESKLAAEIVSDFNGPVFYWEEKDRLVLHRWVKILIEEGKSSKEFTHYEELELYKRCLEFYNKFYRGLLTPAEFRETAHLSNSNSDKSLSSRILSKWVNEGKLEKIKRGTYKLTDSTKVEIERDLFDKVFSAFHEKTQDGLLK